MDENEIEKLTNAWIIGTRAGTTSDLYEENLWAIFKLMDFAHQDPELLWRIILDIVRRNDTRDLLSQLGAGPFEDLMVNYGEKLIDRIESEALRNESLKECMRGVRLDGNDTPVYKKFYKIAEIDPPFDD